MVSTLRMKQEKLGKIRILRQAQQGYLHYRFLDSRWWCQGSQNQNKELDLHHFLRSRRHLRCHHVHCLFGKDGLGWP